MARLLPLLSQRTRGIGFPLQISATQEIHCTLPGSGVATVRNAAKALIEWLDTLLAIGFSPCQDLLLPDDASLLRDLV